MRESALDGALLPHEKSVCHAFDPGRVGSNMQLKDIVLLNDNSVFEVAGDVVAYSDLAHACADLEPDDLRGDRIHALRGDGRRLVLWTNGDAVFANPSDDSTDYTEIARQWLLARAERLRTREATHSRSSLKHASIEHLVRLVGFGR